MTKVNDTEIKDTTKIDNRYKSITKGVIIFFAIIIIVLFAYSKLSKNKPEENVAVVLSDGDLIISYLDGNMINIKDTKKYEYHISLNNISENRIYYSLSIENILSNKEMSLKLLDDNNNIIYDTNDVQNNNNLVTLSTIDPKKTNRYTVILQADKKTNFQGEITVVNDSMTKQTFADLILLNNQVGTAKTKIGKEISTTNEGLLSTKDDNGTSYYFRGNVDNNYVKMGELTFRIVRINGDGSVRLVLNDAIPTQYPYNTNKVIEGTTLEELAIMSKSSLKAELIKWIQTNLVQFSHILVEGDYCTDLEFNNQMNDLLYSPTYARIYSFYEPSLICTGTSYKSNIGLLSIDEIVLAGAFKYDTNEKYYLYNPNIKGSYITLSTINKNEKNEITMININEDGSIGTGTKITEKSYIRPVINVSLSTKVKGKGTISNPYIIVA